MMIKYNDNSCVIRRSTNMIEKKRNVSCLLLLTITILTKINNAFIIALNPLNSVRITSLYRSQHGSRIIPTIKTCRISSLSSSIDNDIDEINWDQINDDVKTTKTSSTTITTTPEQTTTKSYKDIAEENIQRAIQNKKKREPKQDQKRRTFFQFGISLTTLKLKNLFVCFVFFFLFYLFCYLFLLYDIIFAS